MKPVLEVCTGDWQSVQAAAEAGAERIELCTGLEAGGLTPPPSMIRRAVALGGPKVMVLIRPRSGDFVYSPDEIDLIEQDIRMARECGAHGVVIGALRTDGSVDTVALTRWHRAADGMSITFHRAFDVCRDPFEAIEAIAPYADRILTSGLAANALAGAQQLSELKAKAPAVAIMAGGGITAGNISEVARLSNADEFHGTFSAPVTSQMEFRREGVSMSTAGADEYTRRSSSADNIRAALRALSSTPEN